MIAWCFLALADPAPRTTDGVMPRAGVRPEPGWYARLDDLGGPVKPRWSRRNRSTYRVWQFPDKKVERVWVRSRGQVIEEHWYDLLGWPAVTIEWDDEVPKIGRAHLAAPAELSLEGWVAADVAGAHMWWPTAPVAGAGTVGAGTLRVWNETMVDGMAVDVMAPDYPSRWLESCGCELIERQPVWIDSEPGVRLRFRAYSIAAADETYLWAVPRGDETWLATFSVRAPVDPDAALALGDVALRLVRWPEPE